MVVMMMVVMIMKMMLICRATGCSNWKTQEKGQGAARAEKGEFYVSRVGSDIGVASG